jgi:hypothetical protein
VHIDALLPDRQPGRIGDGPLSGCEITVDPSRELPAKKREAHEATQVAGEAVGKLGGAALSSRTRTA